MKTTLLKSVLVAGAMVVGANGWAQKVGDIVTVSGAEYEVTGANLIVNGSFEDGVAGWYAGAWADADAANYTLQTEGGFDGGAYLQYSAGGVGAATNIRGKWNVENGKMYLFRCYTSGKTPGSNNLQYSFLKVYDESKDNFEGALIYQLVWGAAAGQVSDTWTENNSVFTASSDMVTFRSSWTDAAKLDGFALCEVKRYFSPEGYQNALQAAKDALENADYANITGEEKTALQTAITTYTGVSGDKYAEAINALDAAVAAFKAAKGAYDAYANAQLLLVDLKYADAAKKPAAPVAATSAADATQKMQALFVALRAYYESHAMAEGNEKVAEDFTASIVNHDATDGNNGWTWTGNKNDPRNTESWTDSQGKHDYMYFDGGNWGASSWTTTMKQTVNLPGGRYLLTAKGRAATNTSLTMSVGEASVDLPHVGAAGNVFDRGWNDGSVEFEAMGDPVEIVVTASTQVVHEWFSIGDFRLVQLEAYVIDEVALAKTHLQEEIEVAEAIAETYQKAGTKSLDQAIIAAKAKLEATSASEINEAIETLKAAEQAFKDSLVETFDDVVYIADAETGLFMAAGHNWGTRGIVNEIGLDLVLASNQQTKTVTINSRVSNGGTNNFLGSGLFMDAPSYGWRFESVGNGFFISNGTQYINIDADNNLVMSDTPREWIIVTAIDVIAERLTELKDATESNPKEATWLLQNPNFNRNDQRVEAWVVSEDCTNKNLNGGEDDKGTIGNNCAESFHSTFTISQVVEGAPAGSYLMTAQGFYRQDLEESKDDAGATVTNPIEEDAPVFFISSSEENVSEGELPVKTGDENNMTSAAVSFNNSTYIIDPIGVYVKEGETLTVGIKGTAKWQWVIFDNFRLYYLGTKDVITGITTVNTMDQQPANVVYNLQGQRVVKGQKGLFIQNGKKFFVK